MKKRINLLIVFILMIVIGVSYAFFRYYKEGNNHVVVAGSIYMDMEGDELINLSSMYPMSDKEGIEKGIKYNFSVYGHNTSNKDIYYGLYVVNGEEIENKTKFRNTDIKVYLEETVNGETKTVYGPVNLQDFNESLIHVNTIDANIKKEEQIKIDYTLTLWLDDRILVTDTETNVPGRSIYTTEQFANSYASLNVKAKGLMKKMNQPLSIDAKDTYVENNKAYFFANISNYLKEEDLGLNANDEMKLEISGTNSDILFSYKDSEGNAVEEASEKLDLTYLFNKNKNVEIQIFVIPKNDTNSKTDISLKLTQNGEVKQNIIKSMNVFGNNFCLNNGFNKLYDCILASDSLATNLSTAKADIEAKGEPNLNDTAPSYTYAEDITYDVENVYSSTGSQFYFADSYEFNQATGTFKLYNSNGSDVILDYLSDNYKNYYTCGERFIGYNVCSTIYRVDTTSVSGSIYTIIQGDKITYKVTNSIRSEVGLYKADDDYGDSYVFRGDVTNNNVAFGGFYWKILRTNGDNSIRLIYNGTTPDASGNNTSINNITYTYSQDFSDGAGARKTDPTYLGYMYGKNFKIQISGLASHNDMRSIKYYWADGYEFDEENEVFKLKKVNLDLVAGTPTEMKDKYGTYPYTCKSTSIDGVCQVLLKVNSWLNETTASVQYISYSSVDKDSTRTNEMSSNAKMQLENWYKTNIVGKTNENGDWLTDYVVDGMFCNDRSTPIETNASGYLIEQFTYYGAYKRLPTNTTATLKCSSDIRDKFSSTTNKGNGLLDYPIALITADEVALAGGKNDSINENYYLRTNGNYWTMSPVLWSSTYVVANLWIVNPSGALNGITNVAFSLGLRPVINLRSDVLISSGDGTIDNPFQLTLA